MLRSLVGALCGALLGAVIALPVWLAVLLAEYAGAEYGEMQRAERGPVPVEHRTAQLLQFAVQTGGFGGVIGSVVGATSAIVGAIKRGDPSK